MRLHLDVVAGDEPLLAVELGPVPVHVVLLVEHLEDLRLAERQLVVGGRVEVVLRHRLHRDDDGAAAARGEGDEVEPIPGTRKLAVVVYSDDR